MPFTDDVTRRLEPPREFSARKAVTLGNAKGGGLPDPKKIFWNCTRTGVQASAQRFKRVLAASDGGNMLLVNYVEAAMEHCEVCRASDEAAHAPISGTSAVSMPNEELQVDLLILDALIASRPMDVVSKYSLLIAASSKIH